MMSTDGEDGEKLSAKLIMIVRSLMRLFHKVYGIRNIYTYLHG